MTAATLHNRPTAALIQHMESTGTASVRADEAQKIMGLRDKRMIEATLGDALEMGDLVKRRDEAGQIVYALRSEEPGPYATAVAAVVAPIVAAATAKPEPPKRAKRGAPVELPPIDLDAIPLTHESIADGRVVANGESKWNALFTTLAAAEIKQSGPKPTYPTKALPPTYGKAVQAAARKWNARNAPIKIRVMASTAECKVQRVA